VIINPYCTNRGWLFEDFKRDFEAVAIEGVEVRSSEQPLADADAWICIRTNEASCPRGGMYGTEWGPRTVVQVHDFWAHSPLTRFGAVMLTHEGQRKTAPTADRVLVRAIGARRGFKLRDSWPERFTVGWVGRDVVHQGRHVKRPQAFVDAVKDVRAGGLECGVMLYGDESLRQYAQTLSTYEELTDFPTADCAVGGLVILNMCDRSVESLQDFYNSISALIVTTESPAAPLPLYEALACGLPVISTRRDIDFPDYIVRQCEPTAEAIAECIANDYELRHETFRQRHIFREAVTHWQEDWLEANVRLAMELVG